MLSSERPRRKSSPFRFMAFLLISVPLLLFLGEFSTRSIIRIRDGKWPQTRFMARYTEGRIISALARRHPYLNAAPRRTALIRAAGKRATFNSLGYRSPERPLSKAPGTFRIVCEGGSTTFDTQADTDEATWPWRLEEMLSESEAESDSNIEVWNAGFPTWTSLENLISLLIRDVDLQPDLVILYQAYNDLQPGAHTPFDREYVEGHAEYSRLALGLSLSKPSWINRSVMIEALRKRMLPPRPTSPALASGLEMLGAEIFRRNIHNLIAIAHANGAKVLLVTQPIRIRKKHLVQDRQFIEEWLHLKAEAAPAALKKYNDILRGLAQSENAMLLDVQQDISFRDEDFWDAVHFASGGSRKLAAALAKKIRRLRTADQQMPRRTQEGNRNSVRR